MNGSNLIAVCFACLLIGILSIKTLIMKLRGLLKESVECNLSAMPKQKFEFQNPGEKCLHIEGPIFTTAFAGVKFELQDKSTGEIVKLQPVIFRSKISGFSRVKLLTHRCTIKHAGLYELNISGIKEGTDATSINIIFTKPYVAKMVILIIGLVLSGMITIASFIFAILLYTNQI